MTRSTPITSWFVRRKTVLVLAGLAAFIYVLFSYVLFTTYTIRVRQTLTIATPEGLKSASSVVEVTIRWNNTVPYNQLHPPKITVRGTAPIVDLGKYGWIVAALYNSGHGGEMLTKGTDTRPDPAWWTRGKHRRVTNRDFYETVIDPDTLRFYPLEYGKPFETRLLPVLIWIPPDAVDNRASLPLHPTRVPESVGEAVYFRSFSIERSFDSVVERVVSAPPWLNEMRRIVASGEARKLTKMTDSKFYTNAVETYRPVQPD